MRVSVKGLTKLKMTRSVTGD